MMTSDAVHDHQDSTDDSNKPLAELTHDECVALFLRSGCSKDCETIEEDLRAANAGDITGKDLCYVKEAADLKDIGLNVKMIVLRRLTEEILQYQTHGVPREMIQTTTSSPNLSGLSATAAAATIYGKNAFSPVPIAASCSTHRYPLTGHTSLQVKILRPRRSRSP